MADPAPMHGLSRAELREWRKKLLHGDWRLWDLELFHALVAVLAVLTALLAAALVVAMTRLDGTVRISVLFVASLVAIVVFVRGAARAGLQSAERRTAATAALEARTLYLDALARGATVRAGAAATWVTRSAADVGVYVARAVPARAVARWVPLGVLLVIAAVDPWSALVCGAVLVVVPFVLASVGRRASAQAEVGLARLRSLATRALELLEGVVELRALGAVARGREELGAATDRAVDATRGSLRIGLRSATWLDVLAGLAIGLVAMVDGFRLLAGTVTLGHGLAAVLLTVEVFAPLRAAGAAFHAGADGRAALGTLDQTCASARAAHAATVTTSHPAAFLPAMVTANNASIAPAPGTEPVLTATQFTIAARGSLLVIGPSGSGKTSLLHAIAGWPIVTAGSVLVGNSDPATFSPRQRSSQLALVDQWPFLCTGTVRDNLTLGLDVVAERDLLDALELCGLADGGQSGTLGLDAQVGEEGRLLSAGERTRVALARAVVRGPGVLLLDEVGAHLDDGAMASLRVSLGPFLAARTVVEAAHGRSLLTSDHVLDLAHATVGR